MTEGLQPLGDCGLGPVPPHRASLVNSHAKIAGLEAYLETTAFA